MIRALQSEDIPLLEDWARTLTFNPQFNWSVESLVGSLKICEVWGVLENSQLISAAAWLVSPEGWEILWLATRPASQGLGWMQKLLQNRLDSAAQQGASIYLEVHEHNLKARKLYAQLGFSQLGVRKNYYRDGSAALTLIYLPPSRPS